MILMKKYTTLVFLAFLILPFKSFAFANLDLTDPKNIEIADMYPSYEYLRIINFEDSAGNSTLANSTVSAFEANKGSGVWEVFSAAIGESKTGKQRIYITLAKTCDDTKEQFAAITLKTNDQNVRYNKFCDGRNIYLTPMSKAGDNFLVNQFKKKNSVSFVFSDIHIVFDATGFTKAWNNYGGDAI
ncbi:conserved exported hypothetical protein [Vibrio crassostreae]|nr:conserved exported hypothetical protein [Vibrio crassostreae]CAK3605456.1 conserved exported hypothetical protein [Vibrio crassostreae]CAK3638643.1 conserved exported hypothetical protein [Vibrio crassostreae]CAK3639428.1 conserved exported hypothetical protein [Vibrio crassostreae]CAK3672792.1 conserved exported hypothetical protein [Vibrio crassostreae]